MLTWGNFTWERTLWRGGNYILCGADSFTDEAILDGSCFIGESITGDELAIDTLDVTVYSEQLLGETLVPADYDGFLTAEKRVLFVRRAGTALTDYAYGTPVSFYHDGARIGRFYLESVTRKTKTSFALSCTSAIGLLDKLTHYGGIYQGAAVSDVAADVIGDAVPYTIDAEVASIPVYGWLPAATRRENLHQLLFAVGACLRKDTAGEILLSFPRGDTYLEIADSRLYLGGSVDYATPATKVQVTEHGYTALSADETTTLYDNTDGSGAAASERVTFSDPCHTLTADGLTIEESGVNFAVVSGTGTLTGKKYTHTTKIVSVGEDATEGGDNTVSVTDAYLVSVANSQSVAERLLAYHQTARTVSAGLVVGDERPGDAVSFLNPFEEAETGFIKQMDITLSRLLKADAALVTGYKPVGLGNYYTAVKVVAASGQYGLYDLGIPLDTKRLRLVLIGGGAGGTSGTDGGDGTLVEQKTETGGVSGASAEYADGGDGGDGGEAGTAGAGGAILSVTVTVTADTRLTLTAGTGGVSDAAGGETSLTIDGASYTSAAGAANTLGFTETMTGKVYAPAGIDGTAGGKGGDGGGSYDDKDLAQPGLSGEAVGMASPGAPGTEAGENNGEGWGGRDGASGGGSSGAAYQTNGRDGGSAAVTWNTSTPSQADAVANGRGADGVTPPNGADGTNYGAGGSGGHGGSGAGGAGGYLVKQASLTLYGGGAGGKGSKGGHGAAGCLIIYY